MASLFTQRAEEFHHRVLAATLTSTTDVLLTIHITDANGILLPPVKMSIMPTTTVRGVGKTPELTEAVTAYTRDTVLKNIASLVASASTELVMLRGGPSHPVRMTDFELAVADDAAL